MGDTRHALLGLSDEDVIEMYRTMLTARKVDERLWILNRAGKIPFVVSCQGQEGAQVGAAFAMDREKDYLAPYYRDVGMVLAFGMTTKEILLSAFAKQEDPHSAGRQMPGHFGQKKNRILTGSSPVTTQVPHAVGVALAGRMERKNTVTLTALGVGPTDHGDCDEALSCAGGDELPVTTLAEDDEDAISAPAPGDVAWERISGRAIGYGM